MNRRKLNKTSEIHCLYLRSSDKIRSKTTKFHITLLNTKVGITNSFQKRLKFFVPITLSLRYY
jgi:hypothetical protein